MPITDAMYARIWISAEIEFINKPTCLLVYNGKASLPNSIQSFDKIIDIFDKNQIGLARNRAICYKTLEFDNQVVWFHNKTNNGWSKENELM
jgi:hypothetical protein